MRDSKNARDYLELRGKVYYARLPGWKNWKSTKSRNKSEAVLIVEDWFNVKNKNLHFLEIMQLIATSGEIVLLSIESIQKVRNFQNSGRRTEMDTFETG